MGTSPFRYLWSLGLPLLLAFSASAQTWRQIGPPGGDVQSLAAVPGSTRTMYLGTSDGHVFGSHDAGEHWELLGRIGEHHDDVIMSMIVDPRSASTLYATSWTLGSHGGGVYRSTDSGHTWQLIGLEGLVVRAIAQAPSRPDTLVAGATDGLYRSEDSGKHWARISPEHHEDLRNFDSVAIDPHDPNTIYAGTYHLPWKTVDGGKTWAPIQQGMVDDSDVMSITIDQNNRFACFCQRVFRHLSKLGRRGDLDQIQGNPQGLAPDRAYLAGPETPADRVCRHHGRPLEDVRRWRDLASGYARHVEHPVDAD